MESVGYISKRFIYVLTSETVNLHSFTTKLSPWYDTLNFMKFWRFQALNAYQFIKCWLKMHFL